LATTLLKWLVHLDWRQKNILVCHKTTSPPHTDDSIVLARWRQHAPQSSTPQTASTPYQFCPLLNHVDYTDHRKCPGMSWAGLFLPPKLPFHVRGPRPHLIMLPSPHPNSISIDSAVSAGFMIVTDSMTDQHYSACINRPHLRSTATWPNNTALSTVWCH